MKRFELLRGHPHYALNVARLPVPPHRRVQPRLVIYTIAPVFVKAKIAYAHMAFIAHGHMVFLLVAP